MCKGPLSAGGWGTVGGGGLHVARESIETWRIFQSVPPQPSDREVAPERRPFLWDEKSWAHATTFATIWHCFKARTLSDVTLPLKMFPKLHLDHEGHTFSLFMCRRCLGTFSRCLLAFREPSSGDEFFFSNFHFDTLQCFFFSRILVIGIQWDNSYGNFKLNAQQFQILSIKNRNNAKMASLLDSGMVIVIFITGKVLFQILQIISDALTNH